MNSATRRALYIFIAIAASLYSPLLFGQCGPSGCPGGKCPTQGQQRPQRNPQQSDGEREVSPSKLPAVVHVVFGFKDEPQARGSGFIADRDVKRGLAVVITCAHGYKPLMNITVETHDGTVYKANILCVDSLHDLCIIQIRDPGIAPMKIAPEAPQDGERLYVSGYAGLSRQLFGSWGVMKGWFSPERSGTNSFLSTTCDAKQGCSGGPILNSKGEVVGTVTGNLDKPDGTVGPCLAKTLSLLKCNEW